MNNARSWVKRTQRLVSLVVVLCLLLLPVQTASARPASTAAAGPSASTTAARMNSVMPGQCDSLDTSLVGCWLMEEGSGTTLVDGSSYGNSASITSNVGSVTWPTGYHGKSLGLSGTGQYALVPNSPSLNGLSSITLAAWIKPTKTGPATQYVIKKAIQGGTTGYELSLSSAGRVFFRLNGNSARNEPLRVDSTTFYPLNSTAWMHIAATSDGSFMRLYINGVQEGGDVPAPDTITPNLLALGIGAQSDGTVLFQGQIDEARVYNRALSAAEIQQLYTNHPPVAVNDSYSTAQNTRLDVAVPGVLTNDTDDDRDTLTAVQVAGPSHGTLALNANGSLVYTPASGYSGADSFTYTANDGKADSNVATVDLTVTAAVNHAPVLAAIGDKPVNEGSALAFTATATDQDNDPLTFSLDAGAPAAASINPASGDFSWTPAEADGPGIYPVTVRVSDGKDTDVETISITVNEVNAAPVVTNPGNQASVDGAVISLPIQASDSDFPANTLSYTASGLPSGLTIDAGSGLIAGTIAAGAAAGSPYATTVTVADGQGGSTPVSFTWNVNASAPDGTLTCTPLQTKAATATTGEKPQSKVWQYAGTWWSVFPTSAAGASSAGTWLWKLQGTTWSEVLRLDASASAKADVKAVGDVAHILLYDGANTKLVSVQYNSGTGMYQLWSARPAASPIDLVSVANSETATIDIDSAGKMWLATRNSSGEIIVYHSDSPYSTWNGPIVLATGVIGSDDIDVVVAMPGKIGVLWANQNTKYFGFRAHVDGDDPTVWEPDERPASQSAHNNIGTGMADDHMNVKVASDGTLYAAVKTGYDTTGYPKLALLVRRPSGTWDDLYPVDESGTRPIVLLDAGRGYLTIVYTSSEGNNPIVYKQSSTQAIAFGARTTLNSGAFNDVSGSKTNYTNEVVVIHGSGNAVAGEICQSTSPAGADLAITVDDGQTTVQPSDALVYTIRASNNGPQAVIAATIQDLLPAGLTGATWSCMASSGASCTASGPGDLVDNAVNLPAGGSVTYSLHAVVAAGASGSLVNTASVAVPSGVSDPVPTNNSATDTDTVGIGTGLCESDPALIGCWRMEEGSGTTIVDGSGRGNHGTLHGSLTGSPVWEPGHSGQALVLDGTSRYVTVASNSSLDLTTMTIAAWMKPGQVATQDLVKKAINGTPNGTNGYELSLSTTKTDATSQKVFARFNQVASEDTYRVNSTTGYPIDGNTWVHVAATYDGTTLRLYYNGILQSSAPAPAPAANSLPLSIGGQSDGLRLYKGSVDEVRVYNRALSAAEVARLAGTNHAPEVPALPTPVDSATAVSPAPALAADVSDLDGDPLTVAFYGRPKPATQPNFSIVALPDTQNYTLSSAGQTIFDAQTQWIVDNQAARRITYVAHVGDVVNDGSVAAQWSIANSALSKLETPSASLPWGIPYGIALGNHDWNGGNTAYENNFGAARFDGRGYYGAHFGPLTPSDNRNYYETFSAGSLEFLALNLDCTDDTRPGSSVLFWAQGVLQANPGRRAIVGCHNLIGTGNPAAFSVPGQSIYDALKGSANLFLMLGGHVGGEGQRQDIYQGHTVYSLLADYQTRSNGGDGWLRLMEFQPAANQIQVRTFSPRLNGGAGQYEQDDDSEFSLAYDMSPDFVKLGEVAVPSGSRATVTWPALAEATQYEWYATVSDAELTTTGPAWSFTTVAQQHALNVSIVGNGSVSRNPDQALYDDGANVQLIAAPQPGWVFSGWSGDLTGGASSGTLIMNADKTVIATFIQQQTPPDRPSRFYGDVRLSDGQSHAGEIVEAYITGVSGPVAAAAILSFDSYVIQVPAEVLGTPAKDGGVEGDEVTFTINDQIVAKAIWHGSSNVRLDFHPPKAALSYTPPAIEGVAVALDASASLDAGNDVANYAFDCNNDGMYEIGPQTSPTSQCPAFPDQGSRNVGVRVVDGHGGVGVATLTVVVENSVPVVDLGTPTAITLGPGDALVRAGSFTDPGLDTWTATVDYGDGDGPQPLTLDANKTFSLNHVYAEVGDFVVTMVVTDNHGSSGTASLAVSVVPPRAEAGGPYTGTAGEPVSLAGTSWCPEGHTCTYDWQWDGRSLGMSANLAYTWNVAGTYSVVFQVYDNGNLAASDSAQVTISPASFTITLQPGWNLVSLRLVPQKSSLVDVLGAVPYDLVYAWDAGRQTWLRADNVPQSTDTLTNLTQKMGFWLHLTGTSQVPLTVTGNLPSDSDADINLVKTGAGWNLVGYPSAASVNLPEALESHGVARDNYSLIYAYHGDPAPEWLVFDPSAPDWVNDLKLMSSGWGYWVQAINYDSTWHVPQQ